ncbi:M35 family metallo-endopeptidase [Candidatus Burkholderia verschuerenii]|nr:M35 family metallo-endopeptidase [Candidatus Burkholderia verschuerenii]
MTNAEFRKHIMEARDSAIKLVKFRIVALSTLWGSEKARMQVYFGSTDDGLKQTLQNGLGALCSVLQNLEFGNFVRPGSDKDKATGCLPNPNLQNGTVAHVCAPDTATHTIAIHDAFCALPFVTRPGKDSWELTLVHECTHFTDTFSSIDYNNIYYGPHQTQLLAKIDPKMAVQNADNIAWYVCDPSSDFRPGITS